MEGFPLLCSRPPKGTFACRSQKEVVNVLLPRLTHSRCAASLCGSILVGSGSACFYYFNLI